MSTACNEAAAIDEQAVVDYLSRHPDFFVKHNLLLTELNLPHETGPATSLIERQVAVLRRLNRQYREQLQELIRIARDNDQLIERLQRLTLALLDHHEFDQVITLLHKTLRSDFHAEATVMLLAGVDPSLSATTGNDGFLRITGDAGDGAEMPVEVRRIISRRKPACGRFNAEIMAYLFGDRGAAVASAALLPLNLGSGEDDICGLLAIGSHDLRRFHAEMGTSYLNHMGELIGRHLRPHLQPA